MSVISTHVLDTVLGKPAAGIACASRNSKAAAGLKFPRAARTPNARRMGLAIGLKLLPAPPTPTAAAAISTRDAAAGAYRLIFDTGAYLSRNGRASIYPEIAVAFTCDGAAHYHLPLLLSDNSYTTYRGS